MPWLQVAGPVQVRGTSIVEDLGLPASNETPLTGKQARNLMTQLAPSGSGHDVTPLPRMVPDGGKGRQARSVVANPGRCRIAGPGWGRDNGTATARVCRVARLWKPRWAPMRRGVRRAHRSGRIANRDTDAWPRWIGFHIRGLRREWPSGGGRHIQTRRSRAGASIRCGDLRYSRIQMEHGQT